MNKPVIQTENLSKIYRLYSKPSYRFMDMFGLLGTKENSFTEHKALDGVNISINAGEKVAIIGRNGAGKSTLLKVIMGVTEPSSGTSVVTTKIHALLQVGTGFHPEFSGKENVYSYLAQLGITSKKADKLFESILEFSELEEYINQPIKTYSTGMGMRLMFATSTAIEPELLVLDEVLGVGDAYFAQKSFQRIQEMCERKGTTLLLVTHDLYSAMQICDRFIWIEQGAVIMDDDAKTVIKRYESSVRDQQEARLRNIRLKSLKENLKLRGKDITKVSPVFGQIRCEGNMPIDGELAVSEIRFYESSNLLCRIQMEVSEETEPDDARLILESGEGNWSDVDVLDDKLVRNFETSGSIYHRAPFVIELAEFQKRLDAGAIEVEIDYKDLSSTPCVIEIFKYKSNVRHVCKLNNSNRGDWRRERNLLNATTEIDAGKATFNRYGNQAFSITDVEFLNGNGKETYVFSVGDTLKIRLHYNIQDPEFDQSPVILLGFLKDGITRSHRFVMDSVNFSFREGHKGQIELEASPLLIAPGEYLVNVSVMREGGHGLLASNKFFASNEDQLDFHSRAYQIVVNKTMNTLANDVVFYHRCKWTKNDKVVYEGSYPITKFQSDDK